MLKSILHLTQSLILILNESIPNWSKKNTKQLLLLAQAEHCEANGCGKSECKLLLIIISPYSWGSTTECVVTTVNTLRPRQNGRHFADDIFKCIFVNEYVWIPIKILLKFVPTGPINTIPALVQTMAWCRAGDKPLSEPITVSLPTLICVTRPHWVKCAFVSCHWKCFVTH